MVPSDLKLSDGGAGLVPMQTVNQIADNRDAQALADEQANQIQREPIKELAAHIRSCWWAAKQARDREVSGILTECERQKRGVYSPAKLGEIQKFGGSEAFVRL